MLCCCGTMSWCQNESLSRGIVSSVFRHSMYIMYSAVVGHLFWNQGWWAETWVPPNSLCYTVTWYRESNNLSKIYRIRDFNCQAQVQSPKVQSHKVKTKGTWADTKITRVWITSSTGCITSSTKEYNLLHREYNLLHHPPLTQMNCITSSTTHLQLKWIVQPPQWWLSLQPPPPPTPWALTLHFTPQNLRVYNLLNHSTDCLNSSIESATSSTTRPNSPLILNQT